MANKLKHIILLFGDVAALYFSLWLTLVIRYQAVVSAERWHQHFLPFTFIFFIWLIIFYISGLYSLDIAKNNVNFYSILLKSLMWCAGLAIMFFYIIKPGITPKTNLILDLAIVSIFLSAWRQIFNQLAKIKPFKNNILIIGLNEETINLTQEINTNPQLGFQVSAIINQDINLEENGQLQQKINGAEIISPPRSLSGLVRIKKIKAIVTAVNPHQNPELVNKLYECLPLKITFWDLSTFIEKFIGKVPVNSIGQIWSLENLKESQKMIYESSKRVIDVLFSILGLICSIPFLPLIYMAVKLNTPGPFLFVQQRIGKGGKKQQCIRICLFGTQWLRQRIFRW